MKTLGLFFFMACAALGSLRAEATEVEIVPADPAVYGEFPQKYQEIVTQWLNTALVDAPSAKIDWLSTPTPGSLPEKKGGKELFGYVVEIRVNSRNKFGTYTGFQKHALLIRDGQVIVANGFGFR
jgi:hypothetical protein